MDIWVFEKVKELFKAASKNQTLDNALRQDKNVFFLHLLGLDTSGHAYRPYSKEYLHNIKIVDQGVQEMTMLIDEFYGDSKTAYVFTADHGMTDWGSHGDGHPDNTRTPLIVWGSGVAKPIINKTGTASGHEDGFSSDWGLEHVERHDVSQADVATLMAYLAGLEFPVNSVGELPLPYLEGDSKEKAEAALVNARAILEMYRVKEEQKKAAELRYRPFRPLGDEDHSVDHRLNDVRAAIDKGEYDEAIALSQGLLNLGIDGLRYLQTYDWLFLRVLVTSGYLGWIAFAFTTVIDLHVLDGKTQTSRSFVTSAIFGALVTCFFSYLFVRKAPVSFYAYALFPFVFWEEVVARREAVLKGSRVLLQDVKSKKQVIYLAFEALAFVGLLEALVSFLLPIFPIHQNVCNPTHANHRDGSGIILFPPYNLHDLLCSSVVMASILWPRIHQEEQAPLPILACCMPINEHFHSPARHQSREHIANVGLEFGLVFYFILCLFRFFLHPLKHKVPAM